MPSDRFTWLGVSPSKRSNTPPGYRCRCVRGPPSTARIRRWLRIDQALHEDSSEASEANEPTDTIEQQDPTDPMDSTDPIDPIDSTDPLDNTDR